MDEKSLRNGDQERDSENRKEKRDLDSQRENPIDEVPITAKA